MILLIASGGSCFSDWESFESATLRADLPIILMRPARDHDGVITGLCQSVKEDVMDWQKKPQIVLITGENQNENNVFSSMSLNELLAALDLILQAERLSADEFYDDHDKKARYLH